MSARREIPLSPVAMASGSHSEDTSQHESPLEYQGSRAAGVAADTEIQALMEARPFEEPRSARETLLPLRDVIEDAIENYLDEREQWIFNAVVVERKSFRQLGKELSLAKSYVHRMYHAACERLRDVTRHEPMIVAYLERTAA